MDSNPTLIKSGHNLGQSDPKQYFTNLIQIINSLFDDWLIDSILYTYVFRFCLWQNTHYCFISTEMPISKNNEIHILLHIFNYIFSIKCAHM